jgi:KTSC domain
MPAVSSSAIDKIEFEEPTNRLHVTFTGGRTYTYFAVPRSVYQRFLAAPSKGTFLNDQIKDRYSFAP